jgi:hypothetical protein
MHVDIIIPTYDRPQLLRQCVSSILKGSYKDISIIVVVDGNLRLAVKLAGLPTLMVLNKNRIDWVASQNKVLKMTHEGAVIYASDDLQFSKDCILHAVNKLKKKAPDTDAMIAIEQDVKGCSTAFGLLGRKFIERFPDSQVFCPDYIHYGSDSELGRFARHIGRLFMCPEAKVLHNRPKDSTYKLAKPMEPQDFNFIRQRREKNLLWGRDFERLRK